MFAPESSRTASARRSRGARLQRLDDLEAFELGMAERQRAALAGIAMGGAERRRARPGLEVRERAPLRVRRVEDVVVAHGPLEQMERDEARHRAELAVAL